MIPTKLPGSSRNILRPWKYTFPFHTPGIQEFFVDEYFLKGREKVIRFALVDEVIRHMDLSPGFVRHKSEDIFLSNYDPLLVVDLSTDPKNWCQLCRWWTYDQVTIL
jgi:hypothetical protein